MKRIFIRLLIVLVCLGIGLCTVYYFKVRLLPPEFTGKDIAYTKIERKAPGHFVSENGSWLRKNDKNMWEMYLKGSPFALGSNFGALSQQLNQEKEEVFITEIQNRIPSPAYLNFLKYVVGWFNRDMDEYVAREYLLEIYGSSRTLGDKYDFITSKYQRALGYHAAHDIGHALQNMNLVGCTSFAVWDEKSENGQMLIGRNFDFYFGEEFTKDQIIAFYEPDSGYQFMSITWACFSGVVSGMNAKGLSITLNSAKSEIPSKATTPVSLIAREVLQYASNIDEAFAIISRHPAFVSETFLIGSKVDKSVALIEKTPETTEIFQRNDHELIATNHFQSAALANSAPNLEYLEEGVSQYRYQRVEELIDSLVPLNSSKMAYILRDQKGHEGMSIGLSNEKAVNQLLAHHSVIFSPEDLMVWVSSPPYQLGDYLAYNLDSIFKLGQNEFSYNRQFSIPADTFVNTPTYESYRDFIQFRDAIQLFLFTGKGELSQADQAAFIASNPNGFLTYYYLGDYLLAHEEWQAAKSILEIGLTKEIARTSERAHMEKGIQTCIEKLHDD